ncbi:MAG: phage portal protein [Gemmatimonadaceae bacterium]|nr:phage portal protein [Gemmatimonadaceae bacterium]
MASVPRAIRRLSVDQDFLDACADLGSQRLADYALFQSYYDGDQKVRLADRTRQFLEASGLAFAENFCEPIIDVLAERLEVEGFNALVGDEPAPENFGQWLDRVWQRNRADALQGVVHTSTFVKGDAFVTVDYNPAKGLPRFTFNRPDVVKAVYSADTPDTLEYVGKLWTTKAYGPQNEKRAAIQRLNVYYPDRVEKFYRLHGTQDAGGWERWTDPIEGGVEPWPLPWVAKDGSPLGIPVVHFRNKPLGQVYGRSELRSVLPQQDALNKQVVDLHDILDNQAWPQRYVTGVAADTVDLIHKPGEYLHTQAEAAKFGQLEAADPAGVLAAIEQTISRIARRSRTPLHLLAGGGLPSGEALKTAEAGLVAKAERRGVDIGNSWEDVMLLAARVEAAYGTPTISDLSDLVIETQWRNPQSRSEADDFDWVNAAQIAGVSQHSMQIRLGLDPEEELQHKAGEGATLDAAAGALLDAGLGGRGLGAAA